MYSEEVGKSCRNAVHEETNVNFKEKSKKYKINKNCEQRNHKNMVQVR